MDLIPHDEMGVVQGNVRRDDANKRDQRDVQPLGHHLRANHHVRLVRQEAGQYRLMRIAATCHVPVPAEGTGAGKCRHDLLFQPLCAQPHLAQAPASALRAGRRALLPTVAVVADERLLTLVQR